MNPKPFKSTPEQEAVIAHKESAFISGVPEPARRRSLSNGHDKS